MENKTVQEAFTRQTALLLRPAKSTSFLQELTTEQDGPQEQDTPECQDQQSLKQTSSLRLHRYDYIIVAFGLFLIPAFAFGADAYGTALLKAEATNLQSLLFGPVLRIAGVIGAVFGIIRAFQTQTLQPIFIFGGIGAATIIVPKLLDVMFKVT